ncbi:MAG: DUF2304 domain-containing protein [Parvibaculaceae bacterium]
MTAERLMLACGLIVPALTIYFVRKRLLREKHALAWMLFAGAVTILGLFPDLLKSFAYSFRLSYPAAALFAALAVIYLFSISMSVSSCLHHRRINSLLQDVALLRLRVAELEQQSKGENFVQSGGDKASRN